MSEIPLVRYPYPRNLEWSALRFLDIPDATRPNYVYLRRLILFKTPRFGLYLHWIYTNDNGRSPHNHPMDFYSKVIRGGYQQEDWKRHNDNAGPEFLGISSNHWWTKGNVMRSGEFHRIYSLFRVPTVTLVFWWNPTKDWGWLRKSGAYKSSKYHNGVE